MLREKTIHSFIIKDEERNDLEHEQWNVESSLMQRDASSAEEDAKLDSSCNCAFLRSNAYICEHARWEHDTCELSLCSDNERSDSIRSSDHDDLTYVSIYWTCRDRYIYQKLWTQSSTQRAREKQKKQTWQTLQRRQRKEECTLQENKQTSRAC